MSALEPAAPRSLDETQVDEAANGDPRIIGNAGLAARLEPFDSYWQAPADVEKGYGAFYSYYKANYIPHMPENKDTSILVISCGPGYLVNTLQKHGYTNVTGIDSDSAKIAHATSHKLNCETAEAFPYLAGKENEYGLIIPEQELNHLTLEEQLDFLDLCRSALKPGGYVFVYGLNGANPMVGSENPLSQHRSLQHFHGIQPGTDAGNQRFRQHNDYAAEVVRVLEEPAQLRWAGHYHGLRAVLPNHVQTLRKERENPVEETGRYRVSEGLVRPRTIDLCYGF